MSKKLADLEVALEWQRLHLEEGLSLGDIGRSINPNYKNPEQTIKRTLKRFNLEYISGYRKGKSTLDINFFKDINSELKAYLLGYIFADGCIYRNSLQISSIDLEILELVKNSISPDQIIYKCKLKKNQAIKYKLHIHNKHLIADLKSLGVLPNKTYLNMLVPNIKNELYIHFIRGFFDGDGCFTYSKSHNTYTPTFKFSNTSLNILQFIEEFFRLKFYYEIKKSSVDGINIYYASTGRLDKCQEIFYKMYNNASYFLQRKYSKYIEFKNKRGELLEYPTTVRGDNQQPSLISNDSAGSTTNSRILPSNVGDSNANTSALPINDRMI